MTQEGFKRKLTAISSADAVGYSRLMGEDEAATVKTLTSYRHVISTLIKQLENLSNDPEQEYFSDGITDDLTTDPSKISEIFVMARDSTFSYKDKPLKISQIAEELSVQYIVKGSVRKRGDQIQNY